MKGQSQKMKTEIVVKTDSELNRASNEQQAIQMVLNAVKSEHTRRAYERALTEFFQWIAETGKPIVKTTVNEYRQYLESNHIGSINQRLSAIRKLALEASDNGLISEQVSNGIKNVRGVSTEGDRTGNWLSKEQAQDLINAPNCDTLKGLRDRAILAVMLGCGLRRFEVAKLRWEHIQQREGRWVILNLVGKRDKVRTIPMPSWCKLALDEYNRELSHKDGYCDNETVGTIFVSINKGDNVSGLSMSPQAIRDIVIKYGNELSLGIAAHDLRRTFAKLAYKGGAQLEQIQLSLGHSSIKTTEIYLGLKQDLQDAPCDHIGLRI